MARPILRRKTEPFDLVPVNPVNIEDGRFEVVYFEKSEDGKSYTIFESDPSKVIPKEPEKKTPRKRKAKTRTLPVADSDAELSELIAGLQDGENSDAVAG